MRSIVCFAVLLCVLTPMTAGAFDGGSVVLGFGDSYVTSSGESRTHRGVDLAMAAGEPVTAPVRGTVSFAGRVPGPDEGTVLAVSIDTAEGRVTLMPLTGLEVRSGSQVDVGDRLGALAGVGDASSPAPHVHMSLRSGDLYLDPAGLLATTVPAPTTDPAPEPAPPEAPAPSAPQVGRAAQVAPSGTPAVVIAAPGAPIGAPAPAPAPTSVPVVPVRGEALQPGVALAPAPESAPAPVSAGPDILGATLRLGKALAANPVGLASVLSAALVLGFVLTRRSLERKMCSRPSMSHRLGKMLQQLRAGDTLCGLNSCPGHDAFTVPGPPAQRR